MKIIKGVALLIILGFYTACTKEPNTASDTSGLYIPTSADTTVNATLVELQQGRDLYINNCGSCHSLHSPDSYSVSNWKSIISNMAPRTGMTSAQITLVTKYVCRGKQ